MSGTNSSKPVPTSNLTWTRYKSWNPSTLMTPFAGDAPMPSSLTITRHQAKRSTTSISPQVLPPSQLYHPVLPYRHADNHLSSLCRLRARRNGQPPLKRSYLCTHSIHKRALTSTWCTPELQKAVNLGYEIQYIDEVWHFPETCEGMFKDYVNTWLKIKQETSGWPEWVGDDETKRQQYIREYHEHEGIQLEYDKIEHNKGLRALAKMVLNYMWGKLGQQLNKTQVKEFCDPQAFHRFLDTDTLDVHHVSVINEEMVEVHIPVSPNHNIFVASFTTCWARDNLGEAIQLLGEHVLYFDTDSVIYLGEFTSELDADNYIVAFMSGGPKNYGYKTKKGKVECKVRGFRLNSEGKTNWITHHASECSRQNPTSSKRTAPNPTRQNSPDRQRRQNLQSLHLS